MANDFRSFSVALDAFARKVGLSAQTVQKRVAFDLYGRIIRKTPVDTGRARASWTISANKADRSVQPAGRASYAPPPITIPAITPGQALVISNNLPYIVKLENGHSKQSPAGMVAVSIAEVDVAMNRLVREGLKDAGL